DLTRIETGPPALRKRRQEQLRLHERKRLSDAPADPAAEREVIESSALGLGLSRPAVRVEAQWLVEEPSVAVGDPGAQNHDRSGGDDETAQLDVHKRATTDQPGRRGSPAGVPSNRSAGQGVSGGD